MDVLRTALLFGVFAVVFDVVWSLIARSYNLTYSKLAFVSFILYALAGLTATYFLGIGFIMGPLVGACVAAIDATVGWWLSALIGPGRLPPEQQKPAIIGRAIVVVIGLGAILGALGAIPSLLLR